MGPLHWSKVSNIILNVEHFVLKVDVLKAGEMAKHMDLSDFNKNQIVISKTLDFCWCFWYPA